MRARFFTLGEQMDYGWQKIRIFTKSLFTGAEIYDIILFKSAATAQIERKRTV